MDTRTPALLTPDLFEDDGQMKDEVFNNHSFKQSLMYAKGVVCSNCYDPHSDRLKAARAGVCSQCHEAGWFFLPRAYRRARAKYAGLRVVPPAVAQLCPNLVARRNWRPRNRASPMSMSSR